MDIRNLLTTYRKRLAREGWIQSLLCGLICGFALNILCSVIFLFFGIRMFWISILVFLAGTAATTPIFYYKKFALNKRQVAARVDALGLEERILTMTQFENDDSFMARRQREDAVSMLKTVNDSLLKIAVSVPLVIACAVTFVLGVGSTTASAVADKSISDYIHEIKDNENKKDPIYIEITYEVKDDEGGRIDGELFQLIELGKTGSPVMAVADDGYIFVGWSDELDDPYREDSAFTENTVIYAVFEPISDDNKDDGDGDGDGDGEKGEGDDTNKSPDSDQNGQNQDNKPSDSDPGDNPGDGSGGSSKANNQIIDGSTYYGDEYNQRFDDAKDSMDSSGNLSGDEKGVIGDYFNNIAK